MGNVDGNENLFLNLVHFPCLMFIKVGEWEINMGMGMGMGKGKGKGNVDSTSIPLFSSGWEF